MRAREDVSKNAVEHEPDGDSGDPSVMMCTRRQTEEGSEQLRRERTEMRGLQGVREAKSFNRKCL